MSVTYEDFKDGVYIKCVQKHNNDPVEKGKIYKIIKMWEQNCLTEISEFICAHIIDDNGHELIIRLYDRTFNIKKHVYYKLKYLFIPKIEWKIEGIKEENIDFVLATDLDCDIEKYNL